MTSGLRYETGRDMPPGMLEKVAVQRAAELAANAEAKKVSDYNTFLHTKVQVAPVSGFEVRQSDINPALKPHQKDAVMWAVKGGRRALFEAFGLGKTVQELLSYVAQTEREFIRQRQREGIDAAMSRGVRFGRQPMERPPEYEALKMKWETGEISAREAGRRLNISFKTFLRWARAEKKEGKS